MNAPTQQAPASPAAPSESANGSGVSIKNYEERAREVFGDSSAEGEPGQAGAETPAAPAMPGSPPGDEAARRAERRKQLDAALAQEQARVDAHARQRATEEAARRAAAAERERDELKQQIASRVDPSTFSDPATFFKVAQEHVKDPKALGKWLQDLAANPEVAAAQYAQKAVDPKISALEAQLAETNRKLAEFQAQDMSRQQTHEAYARGESMINFAQQATAQAPFASAFLREHGADEFLTLANSAYAGVPKGPGWEQHVLDAIEDKLSELSKIFQPQSGSTQQKPAPHSPNPGAAKPMTTVSNTLAQGRASVVDEETDWNSLPYEERAARLFR